MSRKLNVYLCGEKIGTLFEDDLLQLTFQFADIVPAAEKLRENMPDPDMPVYNKIIAIIKKRVSVLFG